MARARRCRMAAFVLCSCGRQPYERVGRVFHDLWRVAGMVAGHPMVFVLPGSGHGADGAPGDSLLEKPWFSACARRSFALVSHCLIPDRKSTRLNSSHPSISYAV